MNKPVDNIKKLIEELPKKDIPIALKYLSSRDFEPLQELIDSAIYKVRRNLNKEIPNEEYSSISLKNLGKLKLEVDKYVEKSFISDNDNYSDLAEYSYIFDEEDEDELY